MTETDYAPAESASKSAAYFSAQQSALPEFWARFGRRPTFAHRSVLDIGCGHGAGTLEAAGSGASAVVGIDLDQDRIEFARTKLAEYGADNATFRTVSTEKLLAESDRQFEIVVSKDTLEHVSDLETLCSDVFHLLKPGGEFWVGFSPLWYSPRGDHGRAGLRVLWLHAFLPRSLVLRAASRHRGYPVRTLADIGLNGRTSDDYVLAFRQAGFAVDEIRFNQGEKKLVRILGVLRRIGVFRKHCTVSIYAVLSRPTD